MVNSNQMGIQLAALCLSVNSGSTAEARPLHGEGSRTCFENLSHCRSRREETQISSGFCLDPSQNQSLLTSAPTMLKRALRAVSSQLARGLLLMFLSITASINTPLHCSAAGLVDPTT